LVAIALVLSVPVPQVRAAGANPLASPDIANNSARTQQAADRHFSLLYLKRRRGRASGPGGADARAPVPLTPPAT